MNVGYLNLNIGLLTDVVELETHLEIVLKTNKTMDVLIVGLQAL